MKRLLFSLFFVVNMTLSSFVLASTDLGDYEVAQGISGSLSSVGSDTLANLVSMWTEEFKKFYPNVTIQVQAAGSSTAPPALTEGTSNFGPMSRVMKDGEEAAFEKKYGYKPTGIRVAIDALAVYVNKNNPIEGLSLSQVDAIFSSTRKCGAPADITNWGQVGLTGEWTSKSIQLYGRNSVSGTYGYFKEEALCKGDYKTNVNEQPGSASVVQSVTESENGIGYAGIGYVTSGVKALAVSKKQGDAFISPISDPNSQDVTKKYRNVLSGKYPLSRFLYIYVNKAQGKPLPPLEAEFLKMVLSKIGQQVVEKDGYVPLPRKIVEQELAKLK